MRSNRAWVVSVFVAILDGCSDPPIAPPEQAAVHGSIEDWYGRPVAGVVVIVGDNPPVASDAEGSFSVDGVGSTYDVTLLPDTLWAYHYAGLTRRDPWFRIGSRSPVSKTATIAGKVPTAPGRTTRVFITSDVSVTLEPGSGGPVLERHEHARP